MADHNIYIRYIGAGTGTNQASSPTTPWSLSAAQPESSGGAEGNVGDGMSMATAIKRGVGFLRSPSSLISKVMGSGIGYIGLIIGAFKVIEGITDKAISMYQSYAAPASGDFKFQIDYSNFKQQIHNAFHPIQTEINRQYNNLQLKKESLANEQQRLLLGGTATNSPYGRYL